MTIQPANKKTTGQVIARACSIKTQGKSELYWKESFRGKNQIYIKSNPNKVQVLKSTQELIFATDYYAKTQSKVQCITKQVRI